MKNWKDTKWILPNGVVVFIEDVLQRNEHVKEVIITLEEIESYRTLRNLDTERVANSDISCPILIVQNENEKYILDGNHRVQKAINERHTTIKAKILRGII